MLKHNNAERYDYFIVNIIKSFQNGKINEQCILAMKAFNN